MSEVSGVQCEVSGVSLHSPKTGHGCHSIGSRLSLNSPDIAPYPQVSSDVRQDRHQAHSARQLHKDREMCRRPHPLPQVLLQLNCYASTGRALSPLPVLDIYWCAYWLSVLGLQVMIPGCLCIISTYLFIFSFVCLL